MNIDSDHLVHSWERVTGKSHEQTSWLNRHQAITHPKGAQHVTIELMPCPQAGKSIRKNLYKNGHHNCPPPKIEIDEWIYFVREPFVIYSIRKIAQRKGSSATTNPRLRVLNWFCNIVSCASMTLAIKFEFIQNSSRNRQNYFVEPFSVRHSGIN